MIYAWLLYGYLLAPKSDLSTGINLYE